MSGPGKSTRAGKSDMQTAKIIDFDTGQIISPMCRMARPAEHSGLFQNANQASAHVEALAAKLPAGEDARIDGYLVARDVIAATYEHYDTLEQVDNVALGIARTVRIVVDTPGKEYGGSFTSGQTTINLTVSHEVLTVGFVNDGRCHGFVFAQFEDSYVPIISAKAAE